MRRVLCFFTTQQMARLHLPRTYTSFCMAACRKPSRARERSLGLLRQQLGAGDDGIGGGRGGHGGAEAEIAMPPRLTPVYLHWMIGISPVR